MQQLEQFNFNVASFFAAKLSQLETEMTSRKTSALYLQITQVNLDPTTVITILNMQKAVGFPHHSTMFLVVVSTKPLIINLKKS